MRKSMLTIMVFSAGLQVACGTPPRESAGMLIKSASCNFVTEYEDLCRTVQGQQVCSIYVQNGTLGPVLSARTLRVSDPTMGGPKPVIVVWQIGGDSGAKFDTGDGPAFVGSTSNEFEEGYATNDPNGLSQVSGPPGPYYYRIKYKNSLPNKNFQYDLKFHVSGGSQVICDPFINNSGG
jgi:hypothetical protein